jgi:protein-S-isoprenylcysteine O-methyltransferase Ste14
VGATRRPAARTVLAILLGIPLTLGAVAGLLWLAGDFRWVRGWTYVGLMTFGQSLSGAVLLVRNPELIRRRARAGEGTKRWDKACLAAFGVSYLGILVVAALDVGRLAWSRELPFWTTYAGAALYAASAVFVTWAMAVNTHFEKTVRIQSDRDHRVVRSGPYRLVRHPGYLATILGWIAAAPLVLGSRWAFLPALAAAASLVVRTALEDGMLRAELPGYAEYARRVRYRLVPGVW